MPASPTTTSTVTATMPASATTTKFDSMRRRLRFVGAAADWATEILLRRREAGVVLVQVELAVEAQVVRVRAQEALDVRVPGQHLELLLFEGSAGTSRGSSSRLDPRNLETLPQTSLSQAVADLEHESPIVAGSRRSGVRYSSTRTRTANTASASAAVRATRNAIVPRRRAKRDETAAAASPQGSLVLALARLVQEHAGEREPSAIGTAIDGVQHPHLVVAARQIHEPPSAASARSEQQAPRRPCDSPSGGDPTP